MPEQVPHNMLHTTHTWAPSIERPEPPRSDYRQLPGYTRLQAKIYRDRVRIYRGVRGDQAVAWPKARTRRRGYSSTGGRFLSSLIFLRRCLLRSRASFEDCGGWLLRRRFRRRSASRTSS